jgi:hypothetical protein
LLAKMMEIEEEARDEAVHAAKRTTYRLLPVD